MCEAPSLSEDRIPRRNLKLLSCFPWLLIYFSGNDWTTHSAGLSCAPLAWASLAGMDDRKLAADCPGFCQTGAFEVERCPSNGGRDWSRNGAHQFLRHQDSHRPGTFSAHRDSITRIHHRSEAIDRAAP